MRTIKNVMELFKVLDKSNCRLCGEKTCLAFAGAVFTGSRRLQECPHLDAETAACFADDGEETVDELQLAIDEMKKEAGRLSFAEAATRIGGDTSGDVLRIMILGKPFGMRRDGSFVTDLHVLPWIVFPALHYMVHCRGRALSGSWVSYRELPGGKEKHALFQRRGEEVLQQLADRFPDFFDDILHMFDGSEVERQFQADISVVLHPLPLVPVMICYRKADEGLASSLNVYFDASAGDNLGADMLFSLVTGMVRMLEKLANQHAF
jgi:Domain of unknown function (DUF3786)/Putative Fe-S cluster